MKIRPVEAKLLAGGGADMAKRRFLQMHLKPVISGTEVQLHSEHETT
jgi:hypothetical protein